jgi:hypothetical protein
MKLIIQRELHLDDGPGFALQAKRHARADVSASRSHRSCWPK